MHTETHTLAHPQMHTQTLTLTHPQMHTQTLTLTHPQMHTQTLTLTHPQMHTHKPYTFTKPILIHVCFAFKCYFWSAGGHSRPVMA